MLTKELLAVRRYKGRIYPKYVEPEDSENHKLAAEVIGLFEAHLHRKKEGLQRQIEKLETHRNFKVVRGLAQLLERRCLFQAECSMEPKELRRLLFQRGYAVSKEERESLLREAARELGLPVEALKESFWADREEKQLLKGFFTGFSPSADSPSAPAPSPRLDFTPEELLKQYNLSLTQTLLFDALELNFTASGNYQEIFRWIKYLGLMYEAMEDFSGIKVKVDGPASIFKETTKYGTSLAKLIPAIVRAREWRLTAKIRDGASLYLFALDHSKRGLFPQERYDRSVKEERFDSAVEEDFARRIRALMPEWSVKREPNILKAGPHILIPDFGFELRHGQSVIRHYLEIVGFWTPEYLQRKLAKLRVAQTNMLIAVDKHLKCTEEELGEGKELFFYDKKIPLEPVIQRLIELGERQKQQEIERLQDVETPLEGDLISLQALAEQYGVGVEALKEVLSKRLDESYHLAEDKVISHRMLEELRKRIEALPDEDEGVSKNHAQVHELLEAYKLSRSALRLLGFKVESKSLLEMKVVRVK